MIGVSVKDQLGLFLHQTFFGNEAARQAEGVRGRGVISSFVAVRQVVEWIIF